mgnify:CR=1 FL=1
MNGELPVWAVKPTRIGDYSFPGLLAGPPGLEEVWIDLENEIGFKLIRLRVRCGQKCLTGAVRLVANELDQAAIARLLDLAECLR